ncbi:hypothetical protein EGW08_001481 [Elysia chlorotica]|uniref:Tubulin--tyrosine ligase-like protein 12 SET-like domain-containing protein n=1 Tax=Elysia chlorotica TaxID=188477 RepID=A0A3S1BKZ7_ELYCH|nr:hypothetical protein EGW08_001481 [Elysia chlorotica]
MDFEDFVKVHEHQLSSSGVPQLYWRTLWDKLNQEVYDAGTVFQMQQVLQTVEHEDGEDEEYIKWRIVNISDNIISTSNPLHIYLIDHAWTYKLSEARAALDEVPSLVSRMAGLMDVSVEERSIDDVKEEILATMWKFNQTYTFGNFDMGSEHALPKWYIMDEFGSRIQHSDDPNFRIVPFFYAASGMSYSLMWPVKDVHPDDEATRDYTPDEKRPLERQARLMPWVVSDLSHVSLVQEEPPVDYFKIPGKVESLPAENFNFPGPPRDRNLKVFIEYEVFRKHLTDERFEIVNNPKDADVLWFLKHFYEYGELSEDCPGCLINQFPSENVITIKNRLAFTARRAAISDPANPLESNPKWLPVTYDLHLELPKFVSHFQQREKDGLDNHWICKPWNLARSLDTCISNNMNQIIRIQESGPKVACKYIENPVLYYREDIGAKVKFDVRYCVLLSSVEPLKLFAYEIFFLRFANQPYSLEDLDVYEKHFTVMNYFDKGNNLKHVHYYDFIPEFEAQNPGFLWRDVENDIFIMIRELFQAATSLPAPQGISHSPQSRAMYAVDLMLAWDTKPSGEKVMQPMLCEVNYAPDCDRACKYHPFFVNDIFSVLFLDDTEDKHVVAL